jgi:ribonuclease P protein component
LGAGGVVTPAQEGSEAPDRAVAVEARGSLTADERFRRAARLARAEDLQRCLTQGRRHRSRHLDMIWLDNPTGHPRIGLIVPKFESTAVARNRLRRQLREIWRRELQPQLRSGGDLVVRARREAYRAGYLSLRGEMLDWVKSVTGELTA